jgi:membrane associated rhomboid family serine protease
MMLIAANIVAYLLQLVLPATFVWPYLALSVEGIKHGLVYQLLSFQFLHGGWFHLFGNCLALYFFGREVEERLGARNYLMLYFGGGAVGGLFQIAIAFLMPQYFAGAVVGASAGVFAVVAAFATQSPNETVFLLFMPIPAKFLLLIQGGAALVGLIAHERGIAHGAHIGGMLSGILFIRWLGRTNKAIVVWRPFRRPRKRELAKIIPLQQPWKHKVIEPELPAAEFMAQEVDPILDKIAAQGLQSLTDGEKQILEAARKKIAKR